MARDGLGATPSMRSAAVIRLAREQCQREAPEVLALFAAMTVLSLLLYFVDATLGTAYVATNLATLAAYAGAAVVIRTGAVPSAWAPPAAAAAFTVSVAVLALQYPIIGVATFAASVLIMSIVGAIVLTWPSFLVAGAIMVALMVGPAIEAQRQDGVNWLGIQLSALFVSSVLLYVRRRALVKLAAAQDTIEHLAAHDPLTGLLNRRGLDLSLPLLASVAARESLPVFAVFVDISGLKRANDEHGHLVGDLVIQRTAAAVGAVSRDGDLVCRWGGDEFLIVGIGDHPDAVQLRGRIVAAIDMTGLEGRWVPDVGVGASSGLDRDLDALVHAADEAMYRGRGRA